MIIQNVCATACTAGSTTSCTIGCKVKTDVNKVVGLLQ